MKMPIYKFRCGKEVIGYINIKDDIYKEYGLNLKKNEFLPYKNGVYLSTKPSLSELLKEKKNEN